MKKMILMLAFLAGTCTYATAQSKMKSDTSRPKMSKTKDMTGKTGGDVKNTKTSTGVNKDGSPDMRVKANKEASASQKAQTAPTPVAQSSTPQPTPATAAKPANAAKASPVSANTSSDKVVGKDAKGRTIFQGPKNGQYIINANGNKEYIKKTN